MDREEKDYVLDKIMIEYGNELVRLAFSYVKDAEIAKDIVQNTFVKCYKKLDSFRFDAQIKTWLYRITINECKDYLKSWHYKMVRVKSFINETTKSIIPSTEKTVIDITCPRTFTYTTRFYIDFGSASWRAKNITVLAMNSSADSAYVQKGSITNNTLGYYVCTITHSDGATGINRIRIVLTDYNGTQNRVAQIGVVNYGTPNFRTGFMSRGDNDNVYRSISPSTTNTYDLGTTELQWGKVFTQQVSGDTITFKTNASTNSITTVAKFENSSFLPGLANQNRYIGSSDLPWTNIYATTFTGNVTGNVSGTATKWASAQKVYVTL